MGHLLLLLFITLFLSSSAAASPLSQIFMDASNCIHLRCEWRGVGKQCKPPTIIQKVGSGYYFKFLDDEESEDDLLARIKGRHPLNTFTIVKHGPLGELCEGRRLWCNAAQQFFSRRAYEEFFDHLRSPVPPELKPKLHC